MSITIRQLAMLVIAGVVLVGGCTARIYGIPRDDWERMSSAERQQARYDYQERRRLYEERRLYEAKRRAHEAEMEAQQARQEQADIHEQPSRHSRYRAPEVIHFTLQGGTVFTAGRHRPFHPLAVELQEGERKVVLLQAIEGARQHQVRLFCSYEEGILRLSNGKSRLHTQEFAYQPQWQRGARYQRLKVGGGVGLRDADLLVRVGGVHSRSYERERVNAATSKGGGAPRNGVGQSGGNYSQQHGRGEIHSGQRPAVPPGLGRREQVGAPENSAKQGQPLINEKRSGEPPARSAGKRDSEDKKTRNVRDNKHQAAIEARKNKKRSSDKSSRPGSGKGKGQSQKQARTATNDECLQDEQKNSRGKSACSEGKETGNRGHTKGD